MACSQSSKRGQWSHVISNEIADYEIQQSTKKKIRVREIPAIEVASLGKYQAHTYI